MTSKYKSWAAYVKGFDLAMQIFKLTQSFPKEEKYSLTDQIRRSSRSVCANLAEAAAKRKYPKHFYAKLTDCSGENFETQTWLSFAKACDYLDEPTYRTLNNLSEEVGKLLSYMQTNQGRFQIGPKH